MKRLLLPLIALVVLSSALSACGQRGPLYLPDDQQAQSKHSKDRYGL